MAASPEKSIPVTVRSANTVIYALRLKPGQDLLGEIEALVAREKINAGWIATCVGSLTQSSIRFANEPTTTLSAVAHYEIVSLVGTLGLAGYAQLPLF
jgi:predicted DNA-binding protein with PD1-like motif